MLPNTPKQLPTTDVLHQEIDIHIVLWAESKGGLKKNVGNWRDKESLMITWYVRYKRTRKGCVHVSNTCLQKECSWSIGRKRNQGVVKPYVHWVHVEVGRVEQCPLWRWPTQKFQYSRKGERSKNKSQRIRFCCQKNLYAEYFAVDFIFTQNDFPVCSSTKHFFDFKILLHWLVRT